MVSLKRKKPAAPQPPMRRLAAVSYTHLTLPPILRV